MNILFTYPKTCSFKILIIEYLLRIIIIRLYLYKSSLYQIHNINLNLY